jgi:hypothetical protein
MPHRFDAGPSTQRLTYPNLIINAPLVTHLASHLAFRGALIENGFRCQNCFPPEHFVVGHGTRKRVKCQPCRSQASLTARRLFQHTKLSLRIWSRAIYGRSLANTGLQSLALKRVLDVSSPHCLALQHRVNHSMAPREGRYRCGCGSTRRRLTRGLGRANHAGSQVDAFTYRLTRRVDLRDLQARLIVEVARCPSL